MFQDEETHDQLMNAFREYFKANQQWVNKGTRIAGENTRYWLSQIRIIARERRAKVQEWRHSVDANKAERKAQIQGDGKANDTN
jgi:translation initiation factor 2 alpha subunit (eIF-2alpha)